MSSLNTKDEQAPKVEKEDGYSIIANTLVDGDDDSEQFVDDETGEGMYVVDNFSNIKDLQSFVLNYLFSFLPANFLAENNFSIMDDPSLLIDFENSGGSKIYEPPEERQKLVAFLSFMKNSFVTTSNRDNNLCNSISDKVVSNNMVQSATEKKKNYLFERLKTEFNPIFVKCVHPDNNQSSATIRWNDGEKRKMVAQVYSKLFPVIKKTFKNDEPFSKMLEVIEGLLNKYMNQDLNITLGEQKNIKKIVDFIGVAKFEEVVENKGNVKTTFITLPGGEKVFSKIQFVDGLVCTAEELLPDEANADFYVFEKIIKDKATGKSVKKKYYYNTLTKTLLEKSLDKDEFVYRNYNGSKIETYTDGCKTTIKGKNFLSCNGGKKLVCMDVKDKQFGFEFTEITDEKQKKLIKSEPGMTFGYWTTYDKNGNFYATFGQKKRDDFNYNPAHDAKQGHEFAVSIKNNKISSIEKENKENFVKSKRLIDGLETIRTHSEIKTIYSALGIPAKDANNYTKFIGAYSDFVIHKKEREQMYAKNYDYEQVVNDKLEKERKKQEKKEAKEKEKKDKKEAKEKEKRFKQLYKDICKEKLEEINEEDGAEKIDAFTEQELIDVKNIIARLKQEPLRWNPSNIKSTEESDVSKVLNFLLKIITFGAIDISKRRKEEIEANNQEIMDAYISNVTLDIKERISLLNKLANYVRAYGDMNGAIEDLDGLMSGLTNVSQEYFTFSKEGNDEIKDITNSFVNIVNSNALSKSMDSHNKAVERERKKDEIKLTALEEARKKIDLEKQ